MSAHKKGSEHRLYKVRGRNRKAAKVCSEKVPYKRTRFSVWVCPEPECHRG